MSHRTASSSSRCLRLAAAAGLVAPLLALTLAACNPMDVLEKVQAKGFSRLRIDGRVVRLGQEQVTLDKKSKHDIDIVLDRIKIEPDARARLTDSVETALREGEGKLVALHGKDDAKHKTGGDGFTRRSAVTTGASKGNIHTGYAANDSKNLTGSC